MRHIFFIHSSVDGHLGCFHVLAIVNSVAMNKGVHVSFRIIVFSDICPGVGFLDHLATPFLVFWGTSILFSIVAAPIYIPTNSVGGLLPILKVGLFEFLLLSVAVLPWLSLSWDFDTVYGVGVPIWLWNPDKFEEDMSLLRLQLFAAPIIWDSPIQRLAWWLF